MECGVAAFVVRPLGAASSSALPFACIAFPSLVSTSGAVVAWPLGLFANHMSSSGCRDNLGLPDGLGAQQVARRHQPLRVALRIHGRNLVAPLSAIAAQSCSPLPARGHVCSVNATHWPSWVYGRVSIGGCAFSVGGHVEACRLRAAMQPGSPPTPQRAAQQLPRALVEGVLRSLIIAQQTGSFACKGLLVRGSFACHRCYRQRALAAPVGIS